MNGTRWKQVLRGCLGNIHRELLVTLTRIPRPEKWVFVVGCYNSGTTLLSEVLGSHRLISALPTEGQFLTDQFAADSALGLPRMWTRREDLYRLTEHDKGPDVRRLKKEWGMRLDLRKSILLEKSPPNAARTRWFQKNFENAHFIGIVRNGYAVAEGISRKAEPKHLASGWPIELSAYQWKRSNEVLAEDSQYLKHFMWVKYENFTDNVSGELIRISEFLGIENDPHIDPSSDWSIHERKQSIRNLNKASIERLSIDDIRKINSVAGDALKQYGYELLS